MDDICVKFHTEMQKVHKKGWKRKLKEEKLKQKKRQRKGGKEEELSRSTIIVMIGCDNTLRIKRM